MLNERFMKSDDRTAPTSHHPEQRLATFSEVVAGWLSSHHAISHIQEQINMMQIAKDKDAFWEHIKKSKIQIGTTFSPEHYDYILAQKGITDAKKRHQLAREGIKSMKDNLGIRSFRLPIRWNKAVTSDNRIDLSYYDPFFGELSEADEITLNAGAPKQARDPETHYPRHVPKIQEVIPPVGSIITSRSELAKYAADYLVRLFTTLKEKYPQFTQKIKTLQLNNEPFCQFGPEKHSMHPEYEKDTILLGHSFFPEAEILLNSLLIANTYDFIRGASGFDIIEKLTEELQAVPTLKGKIVWGIDWYHYVKGVPSFPILGTPDQKTLANVRMNGFTKRLEQKAQQLKAKRKVTEAQMEQWGNNIPGNSNEHLQFTLLRASSLIDEGENVDVWGIEAFQTNLDFGPTSEHKKMTETFIEINQAA